MSSIKKLVKIYHYSFLNIKLKVFGIKHGKNIKGNRVVLTNEGSIELGNNVLLNSYPGGELYSTGIHTYLKNSLVNIGSHCDLQGTMIYCREKIIIGSYCMFGPGVKIIDNDSHRVSIDREERMKTPACKAIYINDNVWIGANSLILKGVTIGENAIVAAHSVVTKDIPKNTLFAGNPARLIKHLSK